VQWNCQGVAWKAEFCLNGGVEEPNEDVGLVVSEPKPTPEMVLIRAHFVWWQNQV